MQVRYTGYILKLFSKFKRIISYILSHIFFYERVFLYSADMRLNVNCCNDKILVEKANYKNIHHTQSFDDSRYINIYEDFIAKGDIGYLAYCRDACVHRSWVVLSGTVYLGKYIKIDLTRDQVFIHYCKTDKNFRGQGVYPKVLQYIANDNVPKTLLLAIKPGNKASIKGVKKAGFNFEESYIFIQLLGFKFRYQIKSHV